MGMRLLLVAVCLIPGSPALGQGLLSVSPDQGQAGTSLEIEINADTEVYFSYTSEVFFSPASGITHGNVEPFHNTLTTTIDIPADTPAGMQEVTVVVDGVLEYSGQDLFEVTGTQGAAIASVDPDSAHAGSSLSLVVTGVNTHFSGSSTVEFSGSGIQVDGVGARDSLTLDVDITITADASRTARTITVTTDDEAASGSGAFTVTDPPVTLTPPSGTQGETLASVSLNGGPGGYTASTGAELGEGISIGSVSAPDSGSLLLGNVVIAPNAPVGPRALVLFSPDAVLPDAFTVGQGAGTQLLSVTPDHGDRGHPGLEVALVGQNTHFDEEEVEVSLSDPGIRETQLNASDPQNLGATLIISDTATEGLHDVTVTVGESGCTGCEEVSLADGFEVTAPGSLDSADPAFITAGEGASVSVTATDGQFVQGQTELFFEPPDGIEITSLNVVDADHLTADIQTTADAPGDTRDLRTVTGTEVAIGPALVDIYNPLILGLTPNVGQPGWDLGVTIFGVDMPFDASTTATFSGSGITVSSIQFDPEEPDQIKAQISIAADAPLGKRDVTVNAQGVEITLPEAFRVMNPLPPKENDGGCSCGGSGGRAGLVLVLMGLLGLQFIRRRSRIILPPPG